MRISTNSIYENGTNRLNDLQSGLDKTARQISTGRRILSPSDDPVASARVQDLSQQQSVNKQFGTNRQNAESALAFMDSTLAGVTELMQDAKTLIVAAGNGSYTNSDRGAVATELRGRFEQLLALANSTDESGNYIFSGYQIGTPAFAKTANGAQYQGDQGQRLVQVDSARKMAVNESGQNIFQKDGNDIFAALTQAIRVLETAVVTPADQTALTVGLATANDSVDAALENVLTTRASIGSRLREIESFNTVGSAKDLNLSETISNLQDLDYNEAISTLTKQQAILQAAQKTFSTVADLSLFNYL